MSSLWQCWRDSGVANIVSLLAVAVSVWAILASRRANKRSENTQTRLLVIEESRERDRVLQGRRARLRATMESGNRAVFELVVANESDVAAHNLEITMDGKRLFEHPAFLGRTGVSPLPVLGPRSRISYPLAITSACHPPFGLQIRWQDESGIPGFYETTLEG